MNNQQIAQIFFEIADLLDIKGESFFKSRAYRMAAQKIQTMDTALADRATPEQLTSIPGIGTALAKKIIELNDTGKLTYFEDLKKEIPEGLLTLLEIPNLGPKKVAILYQQKGIKTIPQLKKAAQQGQLRDLDGFGEITERNILRGITLKEKTSGRVLLHLAYEDGTRCLNYLKQCPHIQTLSIAGSLRRMKETIGDIDILAASDKPDHVMDYFTRYSDTQRVLLKGPTKTSILLNDNLQIDLRVIAQKNYGAALQYFTGSKEHNVSVRALAIKKGYKLNEYGLFKKDTERYIVGKHEQDIYKRLGLQYIPPELRENRNEIKTAQQHNLPTLVDYNDIKGDLHVHSTYSDGSNTISDLAHAAQQRGYTYLGIADHSQSLKIANGLSEERIRKKQNEIHTLNKKLQNLTLLCGTECDIKPDGTLDYPDRILKDLDYVYIGIHTNFTMDKKQMTKRITAAMHNDYAHILAHPTGRLIGRRNPYELDIETLFDTAQDTGIIMEINSFPDRLDLGDVHCRQAKDKNLQFVISTDSHSIHHLPYLRFGIATARRGWLEKKDIINTKTLPNLHKLLEATT